MSDLVERVLRGEVRAAARLMRAVDDERPEARPMLARLYAHTGRARLIGITGNPGAGKSTLTDRLIQHYRAAGQRVAVVAIDPSSPFTGGAILGDRVRMQGHSGDPGVFIRSLATRGMLGGLTASARDIITIFDAMGFDVILVETVGVGQDEIDIAATVQTSIVVTLPGAGDGVQAIKAGLLEIADIFVVNKADHPDAERAVAHLKMLLDLEGPRRGFTVPIVRTVATRDEGTEGLIAAIDAHAQHLDASGEGARRARMRQRAGLTDRVFTALRRRAQDAVAAHDGLNALLDALERRETDPETACQQVLADLDAAR
ncbi:MAG: methylmalonyl Co-A mutase-associated GTPase MeaB [Myxococcales bacterium]|nr:methylmalonyl Co-A mutase-associated GTPase MeaB [Myxococcales bacterium]